MGTINDLRQEILDAPLVAPRTSAVTARRAVSDAENRMMLRERFPRQIRARFDSQFTTDDNRRHWAMADAMSIDASASWMVRRILRMRSRYEYHNNSYYMGIADTVGNYVIGTGPRLQMMTTNKALNKALEILWAQWAQEINFPITLKSMRMARLYNGESFAIMRNNPNLESPIKLDVFEVEADQVSSPLFGMYPAQYPDQFFDGVVLDPWGHPQTYHILRQHPGAFGAFVIMGYEFDAYPARYVLHDFKRIRPGQQRGVPEALPALPLFAQLRRYTGAVLAAAETAADYAMTLETEAAAGSDDQGGVPFDTVELERRMATVLPAGYKLSQTKAEQPTTTHEIFVNTLLREISRCINVPLFFASLDARLANMASAYVVTQPFVKSVQSDRVGYEKILDRVFREFMSEALRLPGVLPMDRPPAFPHTWRWSHIGQHADPMKTAAAQAARLESGTSSIPHECAEAGLDWEEEQEADAKALGMDIVDYRAALRQKRFAIRGNPAPATTLPEPNPETDDGANPRSETDEDE